MNRMRAIGLFLFPFLLSSCGGGGGGGSSTLPANVSGWWEGAIESRLAGSGSITLISYQGGLAPTGGGTDDPGEVHGLWWADFVGTSNDNSGTFIGTVAGSNIEARLSPISGGSCPFDALLRLQGNGEISGVYVATQCSAIEDGSVSIGRRSFEELGYAVGEEYSGWVLLPSGAEGRIQFFLYGDGQGNFTGDFQMTFDGENAVFNSAGTLSAELDGFRLVLSVEPQEPYCALAIQGSIWNNMDAGRPWLEGALQSVGCNLPLEAIWRVEYRGLPVVRAIQ